MANPQEINVPDEIIPGGLRAPCDLDALCLVVARTYLGGAEQAGGGCAFIHSNWILTAKHLVQHEGKTLTEIAVHCQDGSIRTATVLVVEPSADLAILELDSPIACEYPFMPGNLELLRPYGLIQLALWLESDADGVTVNLEPRVHPIAAVDYSTRPDTGERVVILDIPGAQRGNSGGPIVAQGGSVVAVTSQLALDERRPTTATDVAPIVARLKIERLV